MAKYILWVTIASVIVLLIEILAGRHKGVYRKEDFFVVIGSFVIGRWAMVPLATMLVASVWSFGLPGYRGALAGVSFWPAFAVVLVATEFCFYWVHRWAHEAKGSRFPVLWKIHRTHHSGKHMNVLLTKRLNLFWFFVLPTSWISGLALYLGVVEPALAVTVLLMACNLVTHSHFRWDDAVRRHRQIGPLFRALEHVFVSPGIHHTHHGYGRDGASFRNYALMLSIFDWAFGTLHIPEGRPWKYGLPGPNAHWLEELAYPLINVGGRDAVSAAMPGQRELGSATP
jgi:sterol desaturase/sphingolipid hydroxylase (fatty acid hydroxylase superfamily)